MTLTLRDATAGRRALWGSSLLPWVALGPSAAQSWGRCQEWPSPAGAWHWRLGSAGSLGLLVTLAWIQLCLREPDGIRGATPQGRRTPPAHSPTSLHGHLGQRAQGSDLPSSLPQPAATRGKAWAGQGLASALSLGPLPSAGGQVEELGILPAPLAALA